MYFVSTRGGDERVTSPEAIVRGIASDGGLFVPESFPRVTDDELEEMLRMDYSERAALIMGKFLDEYDMDELLSECRRAYSKFEHDVAPLICMEGGPYVLELYHGPTCAFKDVALTILPYLMRRGLRLCGIKDDVMILVATSGDTGKAALEGFKNTFGDKICVFYPSDGISKMQKIQMCTTEGENIDVIGVQGDFDDCQKAVKTLFADEEFKAKLKDKGYVVSSANSINFGRLCPQIVYYFSAYLDLVTGERIEMGDEADFVVPTGNFGNVLAGYYAKLMGLPVRRLHCACNSNNVIEEFFQRGEYDSVRELIKTTSPAMDILVASNIERLIFEVSGRNGALTAERMKELKETGKFRVTDKERGDIQLIFDAGSANEDECVEAMYNLFVRTNYTLDTHSGCAMKVLDSWHANNRKDQTTQVLVSTASPYKFPQDVLYAVTGNDVKDCFKGMKRLHAATAMPVPKQLSSLKDKPIVFEKVIPPEDAGKVVLEFADGMSHKVARPSEED
ncbi:MAG: threonine synthase [Clostridia bacterium]|nr:threonine synthase [Clostridia bacterium]